MYLGGREKNTDVTLQGLKNKLHNHPGKQSQMYEIHGLAWLFVCVQERLHLSLKIPSISPHFFVNQYYIIKWFPFRILTSD